MISNYGTSVSLLVEMLLGTYTPYLMGDFGSNIYSPDIPFIMAAILTLVFIYDFFHMIGVLFRD